MIYSSFEEVKRDCGYVDEYLKRAKERMIDYIKDVVNEAGSLGIVLNKKPVIVSHVKKSAVVYERIGEGKPIDSFAYEDLYEICRQIHGIHPVREWDEPDEPNAEEDHGDTTGENQ